MSRRARAAVMTGGIATMLAASAWAQPAAASPGDIYLGDPGVHKVFRVDPGTGRVRVVASGHHLDSPDSGAFDGKGRLVIADYTAYASGAVFRINVGSGRVRTLAKNGKFSGPVDTAVSPTGGIYATDGFAGTGNQGAIFRIAHGDATIVSQGGKFGAGPLGLAFTPQGELLASDQGALTMADGALLEINRRSGGQKYVSHGDDLVDPFGMTLSSNGKRAYVVDSYTRSIVEINVATGAQRIVTTAPGGDFLSDVAYGLNDKLYVVNDASSNPSILKVDPVSGAIHTLTASPKLDSPEGITVQSRG